MSESAPKAPKIEQFPRPTVALEDVKTPEDFLNAVDFNTLNEIFDKIIKRSSAYPDSRDALSKEWIEIVDGLPAQEWRNLHGGTLPGHSTILLFWQKITEDKDADIGFYALHALIHEATHTRAGLEVREDLPESMRFQAGLKETIVQRDAEGRPQNIKSVIGTGLDEAVTEEIASEVMGEYLRRTGNSSLLESTHADGALNHSNAAYVPDRILISLITDEIARFVGTDRDIVWRGIVRGYMDNSTGARELYSLIGEEMLKTSPSYKLMPFLLGEQAAPDDEEMMTILGKLAPSAAERALYRFKPEQIIDTLGLR